MDERVTDVESFKRFIRDRARATWDERQIPYYLSFVAIELKKDGADYHQFIGPLTLSQWASTADLPDTRFVAHPSQKAKIGFVPSGVEFTFSDNDESMKHTARSGPPHKIGVALIDFVRLLDKLPDESVDTFQVPAKTLIALLKN